MSEPTTVPEQGASEPHSPSRILLVEDDNLVRKMLATFLEPRFSVLHATNGRDALELLKAEKDVDLVLTDVRMPVMDGLQLVRAVRRMRPTLPMIVMTGVGNEETVIEALRAGATNYLKKPFRNNELDHVVRKSLEITQRMRGRVTALSFLRESERTFELPARLEHARALLPLLTDGLVDMALIEAADLLNLEVALEEALSNAVIHGSLELTEVARTQKTDREKFEKAYVERVQDPAYSGRTIVVRARVTRDQAEFTIEDAGKGFDVTALPPPDQLSTLDGLQGRGLMLIRLFMDEVAHENEGRRIRLIKRSVASRASATARIGDRKGLSNTPTDPIGWRTTKAPSTPTVPPRLDSTQQVKRTTSRRSTRPQGPSDRSRDA
jgi:DNA-binding response OmpR family regulator